MLGLTGVQFFVLSVIIFAFIYWILPRKYSWVSFVVLLSLFTYIAYNLVPDTTDDVARYFNILNVLREYGKPALDDYIREGQNDWDTYKAMAYYFYFCSRFKNNNVLPALTIFICYGSAFLIMNKAANKFGVNKPYLFLGAMFMISTYWYYDTASGIRNGFAFAIALLATYYHLVERKYIPLCYVLYVIAALSHSAGILPVLVVFVCLLTLNNEGKTLRYGIIFGIIGGAALIQFVATKTDNKFIQKFAGQAESHEATSLTGIDTMFFVNITVLVVVIFLSLYLSNYFTNGRYTLELKRFYKYSNLLVYFLIGCMFSGLVFVRFVRWILPVVGGMIAMIGLQMQTYYIKDNGEIYCKYYASFLEQLRFKMRPVAYFLLIAFTAVHFWYLCNGSSLIWLHFAWEWQ